MHKLATAALAVALGLAWSTLPAVAADTSKDQSTTDKVKEKAAETWDKTKEKTSEVWDKTKAKARETKDKIAAKTESSADVRQAQTALKEKGHDPGPIDGIHGPRTSAALRNYQKAENIKVTGRLDSETKAHLMGGQASSTTTTPSASPTTSQPPAPAASTGSPSAPAKAPEKAQTK